MKLTASRFKGRWKIVWMKMWDQDFVDEDVPGHVTFDEKGGGEFQFGYVCGSFAWSAADHSIDAPWEGNDEMDPAHGDICCEIKNGELHGVIEFFNGDESAFRAVRGNK
jgi:hypothetical protein